MKLTKHNGRAGKHGVYNPKHNDRSFDVGNSEHIDGERAAKNIYWDCYNGYRQLAEKDSDEVELAATFEDVERLYYHNRYSDFVLGQNARNERNRHPERNRTTEEILKSKKTCPEESLLQIGKMGEHVSPETLFLIATEFFSEYEERFGSHVHILDWALHIDEQTPHIHERHVFDCENQYGELCPQQEKALEALGFELPEPDKKMSRYNNRKITFDAACRAMLFDVCKRHGLTLEEEPEYGGRKYLEKQDFILAKQKEQMALQTDTIQQQQTEMLAHSKTIRQQEERIQIKEERLEELTLKIEDVETLIEDVADIAYDKAVEVVADTVRVETHKEDIQLIEETKAWLLSPERKAPKPEREYAVKRMDGVITKIKNSMQSALQKLQSRLLSPEVKKSGREQIQEAAKESILARLARNKERAKQDEDARRNAHRPNKKREMER